MPFYKLKFAKSRKVGKVPESTEVKLLGGNGKWIFAQYGKLRGWLAPLKIRAKNSTNKRRLRTATIAVRQNLALLCFSKAC
jgi:hypothetical protein